MNRFPERQSTVDEGEISSEAGERNVSRRDFLKVAAGVVGALAFGSATLEGLSGCSSDTANATSDSKTTTNQSAGNNATTSANNGNTDTSAGLNTFNNAITAGGFTIDSSSYDKDGKFYTANVHFDYNGKTYDGKITTPDTTKGYLVDFTKSIPDSGDFSPSTLNGLVEKIEQKYLQ